MRRKAADDVFEKIPPFDTDSEEKIGTGTTRMQVVEVELEGELSQRCRPAGPSVVRTP